LAGVDNYKLKRDKSGHNRILKYEQSGEMLLRKAEKLAGNNNLIDALPYYRRALSTDPDNFEYKLYLAEAYTDVGKFEESNAILFELIKQSNTSVPECFFGMGCNFMGQNDFEHAIDSLEKYLDCEPDGEYVQEANELLDIIETSWEIDELRLLVDANLSAANQEADEGREFMDKGKFHFAVAKFTRALELDNTLLYAKNNLALALYCIDKADKAIEITAQVLEKDKGNVHANCNMAIFQKGKGNIENCDKYIKNAVKALDDDTENLQKIAYTLCELNMHEEAKAKLKLLLHSNPYDTKALFCLSVACANSGNVQLAIKYFGDILKIDPYDTMAQYYKKHIVSPDFNGYLSYVYEIPQLEARCRVKLFETHINNLNENLKTVWQQDDYFVSVCVWGLKHEGPGIALSAVKIIGYAGDDKAKAILSWAILNKNISDEIKNAIFIEMSGLDIPEPFIACLDGEIVEIRTSKLRYADKTPIGYQMVEIGLNDVFSSDQDILNEALDCWTDYVDSFGGEYPRITKPFLWVCAVAYIVIGEQALEFADISESKISAKGIIDTARKIVKKLEGR